MKWCIFLFYPFLHSCSYPAMVEASLVSFFSWPADIDLYHLWWRSHVNWVTVLYDVIRLLGLCFVELRSRIFLNICSNQNDLFFRATPLLDWEEYKICFHMSSRWRWSIFEAENILKKLRLRYMKSKIFAQKKYPSAGALDRTQIAGLLGGRSTDRAGRSRRDKLIFLIAVSNP